VVYASHKGESFTPAKLLSKGSKLKYPVMLVMLDADTVFLNSLRSTVGPLCSSVVADRDEDIAATQAARADLLAVRRASVLATQAEHDARRARERAERTVDSEHDGQKKRSLEASAAGDEVPQTPARSQDDMVVDGDEYMDSVCREAGSNKRYRGGDSDHEE
jgi:hypothetical protein